MTAFVARYLWVVSSHFGNAAAIAGGLALFGIWVVRTMPQDLGAGYIPILFGQLFAASSGFRQEADIGHFDALVASGVGRARIGLMHLALSAGPGVLAWGLVYGVEAHTVGYDHAVGSRPAAWVALGVVSSVAWAVTLPAGRYTGGVLWVVGLGLTALSPGGIAWLSEAVARVPIGMSDTLGAAGAMMVCPVLLLVPPLSQVSGDVGVLSLLVGLSVAAGGAGFVWIGGRDFPGPG